jgi:cell division septation protein DedD
MPDLNLMDEGGFEESQTPAAAPAPRKVGGGGGGTMKIILIVVAVAVVLGGMWFVNSKGWVKIPFLKKKEPVVAQITEEEYPEQTTEQMPMDTTDVSLLETTPVEEQKSATQPDMKTEQTKEMAAMTSPKLTDMSGKYTIQVFALHDRKNAEEIVSRLNDGGYPAYLDEAQMKDAMWYTVRIGKYPSRTEAKRAVETFALELRSSYFIDRVRSN